MDSYSFEGLDFDVSTCSKWSIEEKTELVYELSKCSDGASEMLQAWSRQEILEILCAEMGKERKYTGLTKLKLIENLLRIVNEKKSQQCKSSDDKPQSSSDIAQRTSKRPRNIDNPNRPNTSENLVSNNTDSGTGNIRYCKNSACKAKLNQRDAFCKRCSCCICHKYDDNKDPSLWLLCSSESPFQGESCGMSCHLECAIKHDRSSNGIRKEMMNARVDGAFHCVSCGKLNDMLGSWRKQLIIARDTRRVDIMAYRLSLSQKILSNSKSYQHLNEIVEEAVSKLEAEVGPLTGLPVKKARGIVNRLSSGPEIQRLCSSALESLDLMYSTSRSALPSGTLVKGRDRPTSELVRFEDVGSSSITVVLGTQDSAGQNVVGYMLWHRKAHDVYYPEEPTCTLFAPTTRFSLSNLNSDTDYYLKIVTLDSNRELQTREVQFRTASVENEVPNQSLKEADRSQSPATYCSSLSSPSSVEDETNNVLPCSNESKTKGGNCLAYSDNTSKIMSANMLQNYIKRTSEGQRGVTEDKVLLLNKDNSMGKLESAPELEATNLERKYAPGGRMVEAMRTVNGSNIPTPTGFEFVPVVGNSEAGLPTTPYKLEKVKDLMRRNGRDEEPQAGSSSKKRTTEERVDHECAGIGDRDFEYHVKVLRWLECEGHIETAFRQKFLTWYSLRATPREVRVVKVFVDTFIEDPESLAGQLVDTFSEVISNKRSCIVPAGFCHKLWH